MDKIHKSFCANSVNFFTKCFYYMSQNDLRFVHNILEILKFISIGSLFHFFVSIWNKLFL